MLWPLLLLLSRIFKLIETLYEDKFMRSLVCLQGCNFKKVHDVNKGANSNGILIKISK